MSRSKVVIENNLKPSQFGKLASGGDDFDDIYEDPLEKSKPSQPIHGASSARTEERFRNEPEVMEFSNARISRANSEVPATSSNDQDNFHPESEIAVNESTASDKQDNRNSKVFSVSIVDNRNSQRFENAVENIAVANNETTSGSKELLTENPESEKTKKQDKADISLRTIIDIVKSLDANRYATKKTIAQGMLDIALLTANASQLKYILQVGTQHEFYILMLSLICVSIGLQAVVGILYLIVGGLDINRERDHRAALILNDLILVGVFLISLVNVLVSGFGMEHSNQPLQLLTHRMERTEET
ncbi:uncharacterized protein LOC107272049 isoform X2 [Cephus cinctus]|uniref:Uncharacterized protein LOC107272049 isoform X2 n=1 Tax=Cephus cinctus TaxID=211228 RepID=A0AAJ7C9F2_CEPCN|nr:uncharacterized protein LOC107272049 isoform X2 [Cephus cinctus]